MAADHVRETQAALEHADSPQNDVRETQAGLEWAGTNPPATNINETQAALEHIGFPPNETWATQVCLEVLFPPPATSGKPNHSFLGPSIATGHHKNASFVL